MESTQTKVELLSLLPDELSELLVSLGEPKYRAGQIFPQLHKGLSPDDMTNVGKVTRANLSEATVYHLPRVERKLVSAVDGTVKLLFSLADGNCVESVIMKYEHGNTICISSQVGCRMGCRFCASTIGGRVRNLTAGELLGQVIAAQKELGDRIDNIVMMGIGGTIRTPFSAVNVRVGMVSLSKKENCPCDMSVSFPRRNPLRITSLTQEFTFHSPPTFSATLTLPLSRSAMV